MSVAAVSSAAVIGMVLSASPASAGVESSNTVVDSDGNAITVSLSDTFINGIPSLDGNPLTREWLANGKASYSVTGPTADAFAGNLKVGYQVGYPLSLGGSITIAYASPTATIGITSGNATTLPATIPLDGTAATVGPIGTAATSTSGLNIGAQLIPTATAAITLANGPGVIQSEGPVLQIGPDNTPSADTTGSKLDKTGPSGSIQIANLDGTATGILGNVSIRPYVSLTSATGDTVVTYGVPVRLN